MADAPGIEPLLAGFRRFAALQRAAIPAALVPAANLIESLAQETEAYHGMSGATRASTVAYVATAEHSGEAAFDQAYVTASEHLTGFSGHDGKPYGAFAAGPGAHEAWVVLTVPTDYIISLEMDKGGEKAFLLDSMVEGAVHAPELAEPVLRAAMERSRAS